MRGRRGSGGGGRGESPSVSVLSAAGFRRRTRRGRVGVRLSTRRPALALQKHYPEQPREAERPVPVHAAGAEGGPPVRRQEQRAPSDRHLGYCLRGALSEAGGCGVTGGVGLRVARSY